MYTKFFQEKKEFLISAKKKHDAASLWRFVKFQQSTKRKLKQTFSILNLNLYCDRPVQSKSLMPKKNRAKKEKLIQNYFFVEFR